MVISFGPKKPERVKWEKNTLSRLEKIAKSLGVRVSTGKLFYAGLKLAPGKCRLRGETWLILDTHQPFDEQVDLYREVFSQMEFDHSVIPEDLRDLILSEDVNPFTYPIGTPPPGVYVPPSPEPEDSQDS
ncbi:MAG: hypothetical protein LBR53_13720 [Deltaproteobacteria bacterium]|jgi:hypothetical protein|nr:hypothetical protein [Deltaproteobacteria bacterium]